MNRPTCHPNEIGAGRFTAFLFVLLALCLAGIWRCLFPASTVSTPNARFKPAPAAGVVSQATPPLALDSPAPDVAAPKLRPPPSLREWRRTRALSNLNAALREAQSLPADGYKGMILANVAGGLAQLGDDAAAFRLAQSIPGERWRNMALARIAKGQADRGDSSAAWQTADGIEDEPARNNALTAIATVEAKNGDLAAARRAIDAIQDEDERGSAMDALLLNVAAAGDAAAVQSLLASLPDRAERSPVSLTYVAIAQARSGDVSAAWRTAENASDDASKLFIRRTITLALTDAGDPGVAMRALQNLLADDASEPMFKFRALGAVAVTQARAGNSLAALSAYQAMAASPDDHPVDILGRIAAAQTLRGDAAGAEKTLAMAAPGREAALAYTTLATALLNDPVAASGQ